jgi:hypothetical protein
MKKIIYSVFTLYSLGICGSTLLIEQVNLLVGLIGYMLSLLCATTVLEAIDVKIKKADKTEVENTYVEPATEPH